MEEEEEVCDICGEEFDEHYECSECEAIVCGDCINDYDGVYVCDDCDEEEEEYE